MRKKYNVGRTTFSRHKIAMMCHITSFPANSHIPEKLPALSRNVPLALTPSFSRRNVACWQVDNFHNKHSFLLELRDNIDKAHLF